MIWVILIVSFLLESTFTNIVSINSCLIPLFSLTSLVLIYPYMKKKKENYIIICLILGLFYDIVFTDSIFVNTMCFGIIGGLVIVCYNYVKFNVYTANIINIIMLITYRIFSYIMLLSINYIAFNSYTFFSGIYNSLLINIVFGIVLYFIMELLDKILNTKK